MTNDDHLVEAAYQRGRAEMRAEIVAWLHNILDVEELPTVWAFCQSLADRIVRHGIEEQGREAEEKTP